MKRFLVLPLLGGLLLLWSCDLTLPQYTEEPFDWEGYEAGDSGGSTEPNSDVSQGGQSSVDA